jgi:hypothetical protein
MAMNVTTIFCRENEFSFRNTLQLPEARLSRSVAEVTKRDTMEDIRFEGSAATEHKEVFWGDYSYECGVSGVSVSG